MRKTAGVVLLGSLALPLTAAAQPGMYAAPPPPPSAPAQQYVPPEPKVNLEVGLVAASPRGIWTEELQADTSPGFHLQLGMKIGEGISLFGGLRYVSVKFKETTTFAEDVDFSHRELQLGLRYMTPVAPAAKFFVEANVHSATIAASVEGGDTQSESGVGFGARGGLIFMVDHKIGIGIAGSYASADIEIEDEGDSLHDAWLSGDAFVSFWF